MAPHITRTQVILPRRRSEILTRQRLIELLSELLDFRLILITAPAGYGKTSLLVDFANSADLPVCWYSLNDLDSDPHRFAAHMIAAVSHTFPAFGAASLGALESLTPGEFSPEKVVPVIVNELYEQVHEHFLLVIDDYHLVNGESQIDHFISRFIQLSGENCHLVLTARSLLNLPELPKMIARQQVSGLSFEELQFSPEEIRSLVLQNYQTVISKAEAEELAEETEGWITGLLLSAQAAWKDTAAHLRTARASGVGLYEYLAEETLAQQSPDLRDFLLKTSYMEEFDVELCTQVFGTGKDWSGLIDELFRKNLFVLPVGEDGRWLRYHHLFRDFMQELYSYEAPEERKPFLCKLADVYALRGEWEKGYSAVSKLGDVDTAATYIEQVGSQMITNVRLSALKEWIDKLPWEVVASRPGLLSLRGTISLVQGQARNAVDLYNQALTAIEQLYDEPLLARTLVRRAVAYRFMGKYQESLDDCNQVLQLSKQGMSLFPFKAEALRVMGASYYHLGKLNEALERWRESLELYELLHDEQNQTTVQMELGLAHMSSGKYRQSLNFYLQASNYLRVTKNTGRLANLLNNLGVLYHQTGDLVKAGVTFEEGLLLARQSSIARMEAYILSGLGELYIDLDDPIPAVQAFRASRQVLQRLDDRFLTFYLDLAEAVQVAVSGDRDLADNLLEKARAYVKDSSSDKEWGLWYRAAGRLSSLKGYQEEAIGHFTLAVQHFVKAEQDTDAAITCLFLAKAFDESKDEPTALIHLHEAFHLISTLESSQSFRSAARHVKGLLKKALPKGKTGEEIGKVYKAIEIYEKNIPGYRRQLRPQLTNIPLSPPNVIIRSLGQCTVILDGVEVAHPDWINQKRARDVFFYLLEHPDGVTNEMIAQVIWPQRMDQRVKIQVRNTIYRLRCALGNEIITYDEQKYRFNRLLDYEYDVEKFSSMCDLARKLSDRKEKINAFEKAVDCYQGVFLPDVDGGWLHVERGRLWKQFLETALTLTSLYLERGEADRGLDIVEKILKQDVSVEEAHRLAMMAFAAKGEKTMIVRQYERCKKALSELDLAPSKETERLYETLSGKLELR